MKITEITAEKKDDGIKRLAAYCRVSSDSADQLHSFAAQLRYYSNYEKQHNDVKLVGIYADEGLSGTSMKKRAEMNRLIQDCEQGKIDCIIVKSISRFARNTQDLLQTLRLLKTYGVTVFFEEQGIDTAQLNSELFLTFPSMIAQQESESISGNMRWSYKKRMESGEFNCCAPAYGFDLINGELVVNETEAEVVRRIFDMYLHGAGKERIADALNDENVSTKHGTKKWHHTAIHYILNNERYMGDALLQKRYTTETLPYRQVPNNGEKPQYYIENSNPQIVSKDTYYAAQRLQQAKTSHNTGAAESILSQRMFCPICARSYRRLYSGNNKYWVSVLKRKTECSCSAYKIYEEAVHEAFSILTYKLKANSELLIGRLIKQLEQLQKRYGTGGNRIEEIDKEIANHWYLLSMMNSNDGDMFGNVLDLVKIADSKSYDALKHIFGEAITIPNEIISTKATDEDLANVWVDENGVKYSADLCKLLDVPNYIENYTIKTGTKIICDNAFRLDGIFGLFNRTDGIKEIKIPNTVTHIGNYSFSGNEVLERVYMGDMVISIGDYAFAECKELTHFTIPNKTLKIGKNPFMGCEKMSEITCNSNFFKYHNSALYTRDMKTLIACLYKGAIYNIPNTVTIIGESAFGGLSIIKVDIPPTVSEIEENAFRGCRSLAYINLPNSIKIIHNNVFRGTSLQKIVLPESVCRIEEEAFAYCSLLNNIILPSSLKYIGKSAFERCKSLQSIVIPNSVESIEDYAFFCCEQLSDIIIPNSVIKVGKGVFTECKALKRCFLSSNIKEIGENVFSGCSNLFQIVVPIGSKRMFEKLLPDYHNIIIDTNELEEYFEEVTDENSGGPWIDDYSSKKGINYVYLRKKIAI